MGVEDEQLTLEVLEEAPLFRDLSGDELAEISTLCRLQDFEPDEFVLRKGQKPDRFCAVVSGRARVVAASQTGRELVLRLLERGDLCGEIGVLDGGSRTADVIADGPMRALVIEQERFRLLLLARPELALKVLAGLAGKLRETSTQLEESIFLGTEARLASLLVRLSRSHGQKVEAGRRIGLALNQNELASMAGCVRESANRKTRAWVNDGVMSFVKGFVVIHDLTALEKISNQI